MFLVLALGAAHSRDPEGLAPTFLLPRPPGAARRRGPSFRPGPVSRPRARSFAGAEAPRLPIEPASAPNLRSLFVFQNTVSERFYSLTDN